MTTAEKTDIAVPTAVERQRSIAYVPEDRPNSHDLPLPPDARYPTWALQRAPERDPAGAELFAEDYARADRWWERVKDLRITCAQRAQKGYGFLSHQDAPDAEDLALYRNLVRTVAWCDAALWIATTWYSPAGMAQRPTSLTLPFSGYLTASGDGAQVVRELNGLDGNWLIEDVLADWHQLALGTGYLTPLDDESED